MNTSKMKPRSSNWSRSTLEQFKVCPLCGAVTSKAAKQCFVCSWHGEFETAQGVVGDRLSDLIEMCPDLETVMQPAKGAKKHRKRGIKAFFTRLIHSRLPIKRLDLMA